MSIKTITVEIDKDDFDSLTEELEEIRKKEFSSKATMEELIEFIVRTHVRARRKRYTSSSGGGGRD